MSEALAKFPWPLLPAIASVIFLVFFAVVVVSVSLKSRQAGLRTASELPLEEGMKVNSHE